MPLESNARMIRPEVLLHTMLYRTPDRSQSEPFGPSFWTSAESAYGYSQGDEYTWRAEDKPELSGDYVVADPPLLGSQPRTTTEGNTVSVPTVTIYFAPLDMWPLMGQLPTEG